ncbi:hypothetical protein VULLAG_LOCUS11634 [Vulpes lagopus]
MPQPLWPSLRG